MGCGASKRKHSISESGLPRHLLLGVSPQYIREFCASHGVDEETTSEEVGEVVAEVLGEDTPLSLAEASRDVVGGDGKPRPLRTANGRPAVGKATLFVVHAHGSRFLRLLDALDSYLELHGLSSDNQYLWLDCFSTRRAQAAEDADASVRYVAEVVPKVGRVVVACDPWDRPASLGRLWCLHELVCAQACEAVVHLAMTMAERRSFIHALQTKRRTIEADLTRLDARTAETAAESDRDALRAFILQRARRRSSRVEAAFGGGGGGGASEEEAYNKFNELAKAAMMQAIQAFAWKQDL